MEIICNWFHAPRVIGTKPGTGKTHGICAACRSRILEEAEEMGILLDAPERKQVIERLEGKEKSPCAKSAESKYNSEASPCTMLTFGVK